MEKYSRIVLAGLAASWHLVDATLNLTRTPRKFRMAWVGVGVGWSAFWVILAVREFRKPLVTQIKPWSPGSVWSYNLKASSRIPDSWILEPPDVV